MRDGVHDTVIEIERNDECVEIEIHVGYDYYSGWTAPHNRYHPPVEPDEDEDVEINYIIDDLGNEIFLNDKDMAKIKDEICKHEHSKGDPSND